MSPHTVNNFVSDLVLMAQAVEELPKVKEALADREAMYDDLLKRINYVEGDLAQAKDYAASLEQKVRDAEVAKDSAETMFLEADERTSRALDFIKATFGNAGSLIQALEPPKPEPVKVEYEATILPDTNDRADIDRAEAQGQSEPGPTASVVHPSQSTDASTMASVPETTSASTESSNASWATPSPQPDTPPAPAVQPYAGKNYIDVQGWVSREEWLAGGGTNETYDYRHGQDRSGF